MLHFINCVQFLRTKLGHFYFNWFVFSCLFLLTLLFLWCAFGFRVGPCVAHEVLCNLTAYHAAATLPSTSLFPFYCYGTTIVRCL